jgi:hypothetical protein
LKKSVVYEITIGNRKQIGSTSRFIIRMQEHINALNRGIHCNSFMQNVYNKYKTFETRIISEHSTREAAYLEEQVLLDKYYGKEGYLMQNKNATAPPILLGDKNPSKRPEVIAKIKQTKLERGAYKRTQQAKDKISRANKGRIQSEEEKKKRTESNNISRQKEGHKEFHRKKVLESIGRKTIEAKLNSTELFRNNNPSYKLQTCTYCNRDIQGASAFIRFHGENCKQNNNNNK